MSDLRILYSSNAFWAASGYGVQGKELLPRLAELPEVDGRDNIAMFAWYGLQGGMHSVADFRIYPCGQDPYGNDVIGQHTKHFNANLVITLIDAWVLKDTAKNIAPALWVPWLPIDHDPIPDSVLDAIQDAHLPLSYSKHGHDLLNKAGVNNRYIPHGINPDLYFVEEDREAVRQFKRDMFGPECEHLTVMVAANKGYPDRKAFQFQVRAWGEFAKDKPNARLYIHTEPTLKFQGINFPALLARLGLEDKVIFPDPYQYSNGLPEKFLRLMYNAADVFLGASMAEGFGIPLIEAQACGTPVITTDWTSMPELVREGVAVTPQDLWWTPMNSWQAIPDTNGITEALHESHALIEKFGGSWTMTQRHDLGRMIHDEFSWSSIIRDQWAPLITELAGDVAPLATVAQNGAGYGLQAKPEAEKSKEVLEIEKGLLELEVAIKDKQINMLENHADNLYEIGMKKR